MVVRHPRARALLAALAALLPGRARRYVHRTLLGHEIHPTATIGRSYVDVEHLTMGPGSSIGSLTVLRGCREVTLGSNAAVGHLVAVNAVRRGGGRHFTGFDGRAALVLGEGASISALHFIDATDLVEIGAFSELAGLGSQVLTHSLDFVRMQQTTAPVRIGHHCMVGTGVILLSGTSVPDCSMVSAGAVMSPTSVTDGHRLYTGVPAVPDRPLSPRIRYFHQNGDEP